MNCDWLAHYLGLNSERSHHQGLYVEETHKGDTESADCVCRQATDYSGYFRIQRSAFRSMVCHTSYLEGQCAQWASHQVIPTFTHLVPQLVIRPLLTSVSSSFIFLCSCNFLFGIFCILLVYYFLCLTSMCGLGGQGAFACCFSAFCSVLES